MGDVTGIIDDAKPGTGYQFQYFLAVFQRNSLILTTPIKVHGNIGLTEFAVLAQGIGGRQVSNGRENRIAKTVILHLLPETITPIGIMLLMSEIVDLAFCQLCQTPGLPR